MLLLNILLSTALCFYCRVAVVSYGAPEIQSSYYRSGECVSIDIQAVPFFYTVTGTSKYSVSLFSNTQDQQYEDLIYQGSYPGQLPVGRINKKGSRLIFSIVEAGNFSISYGSLNGMNCTSIYLVNSHLIHVAFDLQQKGFFNSNITEQKCMFYASPGRQSIDGTFGTCNHCPEISLYAAGKYKIATLEPNKSFHVTEPVDNVFTVVVIAPPQTGVCDVTELSFMFTTMFTVKRPSQIAFDVRTYVFPETIDKYSGDTLSYVFVGVMVLVIVVLIGIAVYSEYMLRHPPKTNRRRKYTSDMVYPKLYSGHEDY